jgi:hypothetical protein
MQFAGTGPPPQKLEAPRPAARLDGARSDRVFPPARRVFPPRWTRLVRVLEIAADFDGLTLYGDPVQLVWMVNQVQWLPARTTLPQAALPGSAALPRVGLLRSNRSAA